MSGALINLVSQGVQDAFLTTDDLNFSLFKTKISRCTNFSQKPVQLSVTGKVANGSKTAVDIISQGDGINAMWIEASNAYTTLAGSTFEFYIGGKLIDSQTIDYNTDIWQVYLAETKAKSTVINNLMSTSDTNFLPLHFFFCDNKQFLPLVNINWAQVQVFVKWGPSAPQDAKFFVNYLFFDTQEREYMVKTPVDMVISQVQKLDFIQSDGDVSLDLSPINHPIKAIFWGQETQSDDITKDFFTFTDASLLLNGNPLFEDMSPTYFHTVQGYYKTQNALVNYVNAHNCPFYTRYFMYSFGDDATEYYTTGTCNFSRMDSVVLRVKGVSRPPERQNTPINVYALGYNVLRIQSGLAGILFSN